MGKNKEKKEVATSGSSGGDPRGRVQNTIQYQRDEFEGQQNPYFDQSFGNYGRASDQGFEDYGNIMDDYQGMMGPDGYGEFAKTGGFSEQDKANIRARGVSPIRAAYSNAEREVGRQRSLQGGYSPNATATLAKMAREQGQSAADAATNVEAELAGRVQQGRLAGMAGQMDAIRGKTGLYGTTPGMASMFGNQALGAVQAGGSFGTGMANAEARAQELPGQFEDITDKVNTVSQMAYPWIDAIDRATRKTPPLASSTPNTGIYTGPSTPQQTPPSYPASQEVDMGPPQTGVGGSRGVFDPTTMEPIAQPRSGNPYGVDSIFATPPAQRKNQPLFRG